MKPLNLEILMRVSHSEDGQPPSTVLALASGTDTRPAHVARLRRSATVHIIGLDWGGSMHQYDKSSKWTRETTGKDILKILEARFGIAARA